MGQDDTKHNLLFISKYPQIIHEFTDAMKDRDIEIETAINGIEAAAKIKKKNYDIVITGLSLEGYNGEQIITYLNKTAPSTVCIIYTTTISSAQLHFFINERNVFRVFLRPVDFRGAFWEALEEAYEYHAVQVKNEEDTGARRQEQEKQEYMSIIESNNTLLLQLISDILDLSKIEAGTLEFVHTDFELNKLMREKENVMRLKTDQNVELVFEQRYETCHVRTDRNRLSQLMINLLTNAAKFTHRGSIRFGYELRAGQLYFWVADTGCGIPAERKDAVFERFVKLNSFKQGTGLGLSICRTIVEHLGGNIGVESEEGKGSTFWFTLPYVPGQSEQAEAPAQILQAIPTVEKDKLVILIAEDNESNYRLFESILRHEYKLVHAWNGREAVDLFNRYTPHLVLMDINMPVMDGYEATAEIRKQSADVPIIAVTAFAFASDEQKVLSSGFDGYMPKPINARQLKTQVLDMLRKRMTLI